MILMCCDGYQLSSSIELLGVVVVTLNASITESTSDHLGVYKACQSTPTEDYATRFIEK